MIEVFAVVSDQDLDNNVFNQLLKIVSQEKAEKIKKIHRRQDAINKLLGDVIIRHLICKKTGLTNEELEFSQNEFGKPYLLNSNIHFNISHSKNIVVVAISDTHVGIDIESKEERGFEYKIAKKYFLPNEYESIINNKVLFSTIWTKKESYIKFIGKGLKIPLNSFDVFDKNNDYNFINIDVDDGFVCSLCSNQIKVDVFKKYFLSESFKLNNFDFSKPLFDNCVVKHYTFL